MLEKYRRSKRDFTRYKWKWEPTREQFSDGGKSGYTRKLDRGTKHVENYGQGASSPHVQGAGQRRKE